MTSVELRELFETSMTRIRQLEMKFRSGARMTRKDCLEMRDCNQRLHAVGHELLLLIGSTDPHLIVSGGRTRNGLCRETFGRLI